MTDRERKLRDRLVKDPSNTGALRELAQLVGAARDRKREAVELWTRYVDALDPAERGDALLELGRAQIEARDEAGAIETLARCGAVRPQLAEVFDLRGELLRRAGRLDEAVEALARAAELDPRAVRPRIALATCYDVLGKRDEGRAVLDSLMKLAAGDAALIGLIQELMHRRS